MTTLLQSTVGQDIINFLQSSGIYMMFMEAGGWKWALFSVVYNTLLAWVVAFAAYQIGGFFGL